jgi:hypothetical protein
VVEAQEPTPRAASLQGAPALPAPWFAPVAPDRKVEAAGEGPREGRTRRVEGALLGLALGGGLTRVALWSGGSTSLCDRDRNQDAIRSRECVGLVVLGGAVGAGVGALVGGRVRTGPAAHASPTRFQLGPGPGGSLRLGASLRAR